MVGDHDCFAQNIYLVRVAKVVVQLNGVGESDEVSGFTQVQACGGIDGINSKVLVESADLPQGAYPPQCATLNYFLGHWD